jgi:hypothetical protein
VSPRDRHVVDLESMLDLATPWCLRVAATLRIADHIAAGRGRIDELAAAASCDAEALHDVLSHLAGRGIFTEDPPGRFSLNPAAQQLQARSAELDLGGLGGRFAHAWSTLLFLVRTGEPGYGAVFGRPFWEDLEANPALAAAFDEMMGPAGHGTPDSAITLADEWDAIRTVVDVGGGTGAMLAQLLRRHADLRGTLVDLPGTVARSRALFEEAGVADRATAIGQSFFDLLPAGADLYLLRKVLNDWPARETVAILRRCAEAARPRGRVVILGGVTPKGAPRHLTIEMVLLGGRPRTITEFRSMAAEAGLTIIAAARQPSGQFMVECVPS